MIVGIYKKYYLNFQSTQDNFFLSFFVLEYIWNGW